MNDKKKISVLIIEENTEHSRELSEKLATDCPGKFEITAVDQLKKGTEILLTEEIDIVLCSLLLPDSGESSTVPLLQEISPNVPIIVISEEQDNDDDIAIQVVKSGAQDYLIKGQGDGYLISKAIRYAIERKRIEKGLSYLTQYDNLTGLPNRELFRERLNRGLIRASRNNMLVALMFIDLDRFKNINDTLGHDAGDKLLLEVSNRLKECIRDGDTVARLGGDEFTIILEDINEVNNVATVAQKILDSMDPVIELDGHDVYITPSIGITIYPLDDTSENDLLRNADSAMYRAKEQGRNGFQFYTAGMNTKTVERLQMESELRRALMNDEFVLYFQPKIDINKREIIGAEALIRWQHKELGLVSPLEFISLAEETGLILPIGEWVIRAACKQIASWESMGFNNLHMAVNLSARQFKEADVAKLILESAIHANIDPGKIEVEITESLLMDDTETTSSMLKELKAHGLNISVDDFGTGYSSLSYLKRFNIDTLKIDRSFVRDITTNSDDAAIAAAIIALGKSLRLTVVAEGVETEEQLMFLKTNGCHQAQGYLFSKPLPDKEFNQLLEQMNFPQSLPPAAELA